MLGDVVFTSFYRPVRNQQGQVEGIIGVGIDVTERSKSQGALEESRTLIDTVVNGAPIVLWGVDHDGRVTLSMGRGLEALGLESGELVGKLATDLPQDRINLPRALAGEEFSDLVPVGETILNTNYRPLRNDDGDVVGVIGVDFDVTELKRAERELRDTEERLRAVATTAPIVLWAIDRDGKVTLSEGKGLEGIGHKPGDLVGRSALSFAKDGIHLPRALAGEEFSEVASVGDKVYQTYYGPLRNPGGDNEGVMGVDVDITDRMRAEEALIVAKEEAEFGSRAKSEFLANTSHELRTPLNAIIGFTEMLAGGYVGQLSARQAEYVSDICDSGNALLEIINDILDLTKIESGQMTLTEEGVEVASAANAAVRLIRERAVESQLRLGTDIPEGLPVLQADGRMVKRIILNLLSNAVKFIRAGGEITLAASVDESGALTLSVQDTGIGISEEDLPRVLEPFVQVDSRLSRRYRGTGLGLSLVSAMCDLHGGSFDLESRLGAGTTATVRFPPERIATSES